jgi:glycyl-tRNA synthetase beta subunit
MFLCARLARIQQEELYAYEHLEYLDQSHEFVPTDETEQFYTIETTITRDDLTDYLNKYSRQYRLIDKTDKDDHEIAREIAHNNQERSRKLLFKILEQNIKRWWD